MVKLSKLGINTVLVRDILNKRTLAHGGVSIVLLSLALASFSEYDAMYAWWLVIALFLPALLWAVKSRFIALITIVSIAFLTQSLTLPIFYLRRDEFSWGHVKPFGFTALESLPILIKLAVFIYALIILFKLLFRVSLVGGSSRNLINKKLIKNELFISPASVSNNGNIYRIEEFGGRRNGSGIYSLLIVLIIIAMAPINIWMFSQGISIVGVEPPNLPYHLSGILHYFTKFIVPLTLAYLYFKVKRGWFLEILIMLYACVLGVSSVSRSSLMFIILPVLYLALVDRRLLLLAVSGFGATIGFSIVSLTRNYVYIVSDGVSGGDFSYSLFSIMNNIASNPEINIFNVSSLIYAVTAIFDRIDGFQNLVMAQYYDCNQVSGPIGVLLGILWNGFVQVDLDLHHIQWNGNILPLGFVNGGGLFSNVVILGNEGFLWILLSAFAAAFILVFIEKSVMRNLNSYRIHRIVGTAMIGILSLLFTYSAGNPPFVYSFIFIFITSWLPQFSFLRDIYKLLVTKNAPT